jgi:hygromycin-B 7''-O-kinase
MPSFPPVTNTETFRNLRADASLWLPVVVDIARAHALPHSAPQPFQTGSNLVVAPDASLILKIFPPFYLSQFLSERASLLQLRGRLSVEIPEIVLEGERNHWHYLVMTRLGGQLGSVAWPLATEDDKEIILRQIGETIAEVQRAPLGRLSEIEASWPQFIMAQIAGCRARHERLGMPQRYLDGLDDLLREAASIIPCDSPPVILTGEYIPENFLLTNTANGWRLSGLIDFGDVMTGWGEYDLLGPSAFMTSGRPERVRALLAGFGYSRAEMNSGLARRLLTLMLLHRASDPIRHIDIADWQERTASLNDLQRLLWPF